MIPPIDIQEEVPLCANETLVAYDEATNRFVLADFALEHSRRYTFRWPRDVQAFEVEALEFLAQLAGRLVGQALECVVGWKHDPDGTYKIRHKSLVASLQQAGWSAATEKESGIATLRTDPSQLVKLHTQLERHRLGWFLVLGTDLPETAAWLAPAFRPTIKAFAQRGALTPSREFLLALQQRSCMLAYALRSDDILPSVVVVTAGPLPNDGR